jgi:AcrR family transcriptional regulator
MVTMSPASTRLRSPHDRAGRAERILDAAAELLLRFGYRRVTIDDIARQADIGKGTVYLHWKTSADLFRAVFEREVLRAVHELAVVLRRDPGGWRPHRLARAYFLAIMNRPLLTALFLGDAELLGKLARPQGGAREDRHRLMPRAYFALLAGHGVLRDDVSAGAIAYAFMATMEGFIRAQAADGRGLGIEASGDLLALTVQRAFESERELPPAAEKRLASRVADLIAGLALADRSDLGGG